VTIVQFYHLTATPLEQALPKLLEKAIAGGYRALILAENDARAEQINTLLWSYEPTSFLPHGSINDGKPAQQPILIASDNTSINAAKLLIITDGRNVLENNADYEKVLDIFDGTDAQKTASARLRWTAYKNAGYDISYFKQNERGGWQKK
jgi:DNA polymerase-3 subunit chi